MTETHEPAIRAKVAWDKGKIAFNGVIKNPDGKATDKAIEYLRNLGREREIGMSVEDFDVMLGIWLEADLCTAGFVSDQINEYKDKPKRPVKQVEPGYYTKDHQYYVVVLNKAGNATYAKRLVVSDGKASWEYEKGAVRTLGDLHPLSVTEAATWGHLHGKCIICCRPLTDAKSVMGGIGPVCKKKLER